MEMLTFATAGSVDDGKSTLIGRLLLDSDKLLKDQLESLKIASDREGEEDINLAYITDGHRAEREQKITIDVAYRYFSTPKRKFIIADAPGHEQYTRNMVTAASGADCAVVLIDARNGIVTQSKRRGFITSLLRIPHIVVAINKMDLVDYSQEVFDKLVDEYSRYAEKLNIHDLVFIPISALKGDNVVHKSGNMPWYGGMSLLYYLEHVAVTGDKNLIDFRFPVQYVIRPHQDFRGFAGTIASGSVKVGEDVTVLPSGLNAKVSRIISDRQDAESGSVSESVVLVLSTEIDVGRGDMIVRKNNIPLIDTKIEAILCWLDSKTSLDKEKAYVLMHTTRTVKAYIRELVYLIDVNTLHRQDAHTLAMNEIGRVEIETSSPIFYDSYHENRETGSFILIDPDTDYTVAAGMIRHELRDSTYIRGKVPDGVPKNLRWENFSVTREEREKKLGHKGHVIWFTGLSGAGKTTIARELKKRLFLENRLTYILDGDNVRHGLNSDLGFTDNDRRENIRRIGHVADLFSKLGCVVICSFISPDRAVRDQVRALYEPGRFSEIYIKCSVDACSKRDPKGLYEKAFKGIIPNFTGVSAPYEEPEKPELTLDTEGDTVNECVERILSYLADKIKLK